MTYSKRKNSVRRLILIALTLGTSIIALRSHGAPRRSLRKRSWQRYPLQVRSQRNENDRRLRLEHAGRHRLRRQRQSLYLNSGRGQRFQNRT